MTFFQRYSSTNLRQIDNRRAKAEKERLNALQLNHPDALLGIPWTYERWKKIEKIFCVVEMPDEIPLAVKVIEVPKIEPLLVKDGELAKKRMKSDNDDSTESGETSYMTSNSSSSTFDAWDVINVKEAPDDCRQDLSFIQIEVEGKVDNWLKVHETFLDMTNDDDDDDMPVMKAIPDATKGKRRKKKRKELKDSSSITSSLGKVAFDEIEDKEHKIDAEKKDKNKPKKIEQEVASKKKADTNKFFKVFPTMERKSSSNMVLFDEIDGEAVEVDVEDEVSSEKKMGKKKNQKLPKVDQKSDASNTVLFDEIDGLKPENGVKKKDGSKPKKTEQDEIVGKKKANQKKSWKFISKIGKKSASNMVIFDEIDGKTSEMDVQKKGQDDDSSKKKVGKKKSQKILPIVQKKNASNAVSFDDIDGLKLENGVEKKNVSKPKKIEQDEVAGKKKANKKKSWKLLSKIGKKSASNTEIDGKKSETVIEKADVNKPKKVEQDEVAGKKTANKKKPWKFLSKAEKKSAFDFESLDVMDGKTSDIDTEKKHVKKPKKIDQDEVGSKKKGGKKKPWKFLSKIGKKGASNTFDEIDIEKEAERDEVANKNKGDLRKYRKAVKMEEQTVRIIDETVKVHAKKIKPPKPRKLMRTEVQIEDEDINSGNLANGTEDCKSINFQKKPKAQEKVEARKSEMNYVGDQDDEREKEKGFGMKNGVEKSGSESEAHLLRSLHREQIEREGCTSEGNEIRREKDEGRNLKLEAFRSCDDGEAHTLHSCGEQNWKMEFEECDETDRMERRRKMRVHQQQVDEADETNKLDEAAGYEQSDGSKQFGMMENIECDQTEKMQHKREQRRKMREQQQQVDEAVATNKMDKAADYEQSDGSKQFGMMENNECDQTEKMQRKREQRRKMREQQQQVDEAVATNKMDKAADYEQSDGSKQFGTMENNECYQTEKMQRKREQRRKMREQQQHVDEAVETNKMDEAAGKQQSDGSKQFGMMENIECDQTEKMQRKREQRRKMREQQQQVDEAVATNKMDKAADYEQSDRSKQFGMMENIECDQTEKMQRKREQRRKMREQQQQVDEAVATNKMDKAADYEQSDGSKQFGMMENNECYQTEKMQRKREQRRKMREQQQQVDEAVATNKMDKAADYEQSDGSKQFGMMENNECYQTEKMQRKREQRRKMREQQQQVDEAVATNKMDKAADYEQSDGSKQFGTMENNECYQTEKMQRKREQHRKMREQQQQVDEAVANKMDKAADYEQSDGSKQFGMMENNECDQTEKMQRKREQRRKMREQQQQVDEAVATNKMDKAADYEQSDGSKQFGMMENNECDQTEKMQRKREQRRKMREQQQQVDEAVATNKMDKAADYEQSDGNKQFGMMENNECYQTEKMQRKREQRRKMREQQQQVDEVVETNKMDEAAGKQQSDGSKQFGMMENNECDQTEKMERKREQRRKMREQQQYVDEAVATNKMDKAADYEQSDGSKQFGMTENNECNPTEKMQRKREQRRKMREQQQHVDEAVETNKMDEAAGYEQSDGSKQFGTMENNECDQTEKMQRKREQRRKMREQQQQVDEAVATNKMDKAADYEQSDGSKQFGMMENNECDQTEKMQRKREQRRKMREQQQQVDEAVETNKMDEAAGYEQSDGSKQFGTMENNECDQTERMQRKREQRRKMREQQQHVDEAVATNKMDEAAGKQQSDGSKQFGMMENNECDQTERMQRKREQRRKMREQQQHADVAVETNKMDQAAGYEQSDGSRQLNMMENNECDQTERMKCKREQRRKMRELQQHIEEVYKINKLDVAAGYGQSDGSRQYGNIENDERHKTEGVTRKREIRRQQQQVDEANERNNLDKAARYNPSDGSRQAGMMENDERDKTEKMAGKREMRRKQQQADEKNKLDGAAGYVQSDGRKQYGNMKNDECDEVEVIGRKREQRRKMRKQQAQHVDEGAEINQLGEAAGYDLSYASKHYGKMGYDECDETEKMLRKREEQRKKKKQQQRTDEDDEINKLGKAAGCDRSNGNKYCGNIGYDECDETERMERKQEQQRKKKKQQQHVDRPDETNKLDEAAGYDLSYGSQYYGEMGYDECDETEKMLRKREEQRKKKKQQQRTDEDDEINKLGKAAGCDRSNGNKYCGNIGYDECDETERMERKQEQQRKKKKQQQHVDRPDETNKLDEAAGYDLSYGSQYYGEMGYDECDETEKMLRKREEQRKKKKQQQRTDEGDEINKLGKAAGCDPLNGNKHCGKMGYDECDEMEKMLRKREEQRKKKKQQQRTDEGDEINELGKAAGSDPSYGNKYCGKMGYDECDETEKMLRKREEQRKKKKQQQRIDEGNEIKLDEAAARDECNGGEQLGTKQTKKNIFGRAVGKIGKLFQN